MGADDNSPYWFDVSALPGARPLKGLHSTTRRRERRAAVRAFARANGFDFHPHLVRDAEEFPAMSLGGTSVDVLQLSDRARVEFGNQGMRLLALGQDPKAGRRGYIAVRHDLVLPHLLLESRAPSAATPQALLAKAWYFVPSAGDAYESPVARFRHRSRALDLGAEPRARFRAETDGDAQAAESLLSGPALARVMEICRWFDVEVVGSWLFLYSNFGDVVTADPEIWAWVFSITSRALEIIDTWSGCAPSERPAFHTDRWIDRPAVLDGSLAVLRRSR